MKLKSGLLWIVLLLIMSSCVSYENLTIEVLKPAKFSLPVNIRKIAVISRNLKYVDDTLQYYQVKNRQLIKDEIKFNTDSLAQITCIDSLASRLLVQNCFDSILILPVNSLPTLHVKAIGPGKAEWYKNMATKTGADGLILLDMFSCFYSIQKDESTSTTVANVLTSNIWSIYDCKNHKIIDRFAQIDTLFWDGTDDNGNYNEHRIPGKKEAIILASAVIGDNYSKHIAPSWCKVYREIMSCGKPELKQAAMLAQKSKWEEASPIWQKYANSKNKRDKIISIYNLALAGEMNGQIDQALELTARAAKLSTGTFWSNENEAVRKYSAVLYRRKLEINKLDAQHELR